MSETEKISRRDFLKGLGKSAAAIGAGVVVGEMGVDVNKVAAQEEEQNVEHLGYLEGLRNPSLMIDQLTENIIKNNAQEGYSNFLEEFSLEHSSNPEIAQANREALDYAFKNRGLADRVINAVDRDLESQYPDEDTESRLKHTMGGENSTLHSIVMTFRGMEGRSRLHISATDNSDGISRELSRITEWVKPMHEQQDYAQERQVFAQRAIELNEQNNLYTNTAEAWAEKGPEVQEAFLNMLDIQEKHFPIASAGIGKIQPGEYAFHSENNLRIEEITLSNLFEVGILQDDPSNIDSAMVELVHEQSHQFQKSSLDIDLISVLHPEDFLKHYETTQEVIEDFKHKIQEMDPSDIDGINYDPNVRIKFSDAQNIDTDVEHSNVKSEMQFMKNVANFLDEHQDIVEQTGMEYYFSENGQSPKSADLLLSSDKLIPRMEIYGAIANSLNNLQVKPPEAINSAYIDQLESIMDERYQNFSKGALGERVVLDEVMEAHSANMLATYTVLAKMESQNLLLDNPDMLSSFNYFKKKVEGQVLHATQGPSGQYLGPPNQRFELSIGQEEQNERNKQEARNTRLEQAARFPDLGLYSTETEQFVEGLYDQVPKRMEAQAKLWGGNSLEDYTSFANEVLAQYE